MDADKLGPSVSGNGRGEPLKEALSWIEDQHAADGGLSQPPPKHLLLKSLHSGKDRLSRRDGTLKMGG